mgnify:CR=1 FL=1
MLSEEFSLQFDRDKKRAMIESRPTIRGVWPGGSQSLIDLIGEINES